MKKWVSVVTNKLKWGYLQMIGRGRNRSSNTSSRRQEVADNTSTAGSTTTGFLVGGAAGGGSTDSEGVGGGSFGTGAFSDPVGADAMAGPDAVVEANTRAGAGSSEGDAGDEQPQGAQAQQAPIIYSQEPNMEAMRAADDVPETPLSRANRLRAESGMPPLDQFGREPQAAEGEGQGEQEA